jgi:hypothetical protein
MPSPTYRLVGGKAKIQIEDLLGSKPSGGWVYQAPGQGNPGAEGAHYYYRSQTQEGSHKRAPEQGRFGFSVEIEEAGQYKILLRATRDTNNPGDARNDIWIRVDGNTQKVMPKGTPELTSGGEGFVKFKGAQTAWVNAHQFSTDVHGDKNPESVVVLGKGVHKIDFAPRSTGYHIDSVQVIKVGKVGTSPVLPEPEPEPGGGTTSARVATRVDDVEAAGGLYDADLDLGRSGGAANPVGLRFTGLELEAGAEIESAYFVFTASAASAAGGSLEIELQNYLGAKNFLSGKPLDDRSYLAETVVWDDIGAWEEGKAYRSADVSALIEAVARDGGLDALDALAFRISGTGAHSAHAFESAGPAPELVIEYA